MFRLIFSSWHCIFQLFDKLDSEFRCGVSFQGILDKPACDFKLYLMEITISHYQSLKDKVIYHFTGTSDDTTEQIAIL